MLSLPQLQRHLLAQDHDQLLVDLHRNGTLLPLPIRVRLSQSHAACLGLALRRVVEITHGPTHLSRSIIDQLLASPETHDDPVTLAAHLSGIERVLLLGSCDPDQHFVLRQQADQLWERLTHLQHPTGLLAAPSDHTETDFALSSAFLLYLIAPISHHARYLDLGLLLTALEDRRPLPDAAAEELVQVALAAWPRAAVVDHPVPASAA